MGRSAARTTDDELEYYASPGPMTRLDQLDPALLADLPDDPASIAQVVQGLVLHPHLAVAYDVEVPEERLEEVQVRPAVDVLRGALARDGRPLAEARPPERRILGNCRHFSTLTVALLRRVGIPSRARCGFGGYFAADRWLDHWIVERWDGDRWVRHDAQVDDLQRQLFRLPFDPIDLPVGRFLAGGEAWLACQEGREDGDAFGILDEWGQWFIRGNIARDLAALNKVELLPWDLWGDLAQDEPPPGGDPWVDALSTLIGSGDHAAIRARYEADGSLRATRHLRIWTPNGPQPVDVPQLA